MKIDKKYCMSSYLMLRTIYGERTFKENVVPRQFAENSDRFPVNNSEELEEHLASAMVQCFQSNKPALALSGGIDSAILAKFCPKGTVAYTFKCVVPGVDVVDETKIAAQYAEECGLEHRIVEIFWEDFETYAPVLMKHKGAPIHSIEVQIYKAALQAKRDGFDTLIFGESADVNYGGMSNILQKDWLAPDFLERYAYLMPHKALLNPVILTEPFLKYTDQTGKTDTHEFMRHVFYCESMGTYTNATETAQINYLAPFSKTYMNVPLDYERVRRGENKYLVREIFQRLYKEFQVPDKIPMPRPMNEWLAAYKGSDRDEFWPNCAMSLTGDQKWQVWCLSKFLDLCDQNYI